MIGKLLRKARRPKHGKNCHIAKEAFFDGDMSGIEIGDNVRIERNVILRCKKGSKIIIGDNTMINTGAVLDTVKEGSIIKIGNNCSVQPYCVLYGLGGLEIGNYVMIATHSIMIPANHVFENPNQIMKMQGLTQQGIKIHDNVWIGAGVKILDGVTIGTGSVVGAGSVVTKDVEDNSINVGTPAKKIRSRK